MRERPILFSAPMVRAILAGTKTQTRRVVKETPGGGVARLSEWMASEPLARIDASNGAIGVVWPHGAGRSAPLLICPYGEPGDRLWVRETFSPFAIYGAPVRIDAASYVVLADGTQVYRDGAIVPGLAEYAPGAGDHIRWRPSIHMPRWASRLTLEVTSVRVERLNSITKRDAIAEGAHAVDGPVGAYGDGPRWSMDRPHPIVALGREEGPRHCLGSPQMAFANLWNRIHGSADAWDRDPWVWVVGFRVLCPEGAA